MKSALLFLIRFYQVYLSQVLHLLTGSVSQCRFEKTCSEYAFDVVQEYGAIKGTVMAFRRLVSCQPFIHHSSSIVKVKDRSLEGDRTFSL